WCSMGTQALFLEKETRTSGLNFSNDLQPTVDKNILEYLYYYNGGGVAIGDINQDGLEDVLLTANEKPDQLFLNKGNLVFEDITEKGGIAATSSWSTGVSMDDVNGDGLLDIYICKVAPMSEKGTHNLLYINNGDATFTEAAQKYGLDFSGYTTQAAFFDYDLDGDLDMYLLNQSVHSTRSYGKVNKRKVKDELSGDRLFENRVNESEGRFVEVTEKAGIYSSALGYGLAIITTDLNADGYPDIYVGNDFHENDYVYLNNGDKTFTESMATLLNHSTKFTMGVDVADMNNDGRMDIFTTDMLPYDEVVALKSGGEDPDQVFSIRKELGFEDQYARNHFQIQRPDAKFADVALMTNTYATDWSWSVLLQDFDNNGLSDIFISNGIVKRPNDLDYIKFVNQMGQSVNKKLTASELAQFLDKMPTQKLQNLLFLQQANLQFSELPAAKMGSPTFSNGAAYADLDRDGDLDLVINNINQPVSLWENTNAANNHFIAFQFKRETNLTNKGAVVEIFYGDQKQTKVYTTTRGYQASSTHRLIFGLNRVAAIDSVKIIWPDRTQQILTNLPINQYHLIKKESTVAYEPTQPTASDWSLSVLPIKHEENKFEDYNADKLIPELLSKEGPAVVYADFNQDG
ncbi:MAG: CRTAC1 family protein, partial [Bacteroidota bacterium]